MGQSSSRLRGSSSPADSAASGSRPVVNGTNTSDIAVTNTESTNVQGSNDRRRRSKGVRRSILNLVKPRSATRSEDNRESNNNSNRKSWRHSRRWSKAPHVDLGQNADAGPSNPPPALAHGSTPKNNDSDQVRASISAHEPREEVGAERPINAGPITNPDLESPQVEPQQNLSSQSTAISVMEEASENQRNDHLDISPEGRDSSSDGRVDTQSQQSTTSAFPPPPPPPPPPAFESAPSQQPATRQFPPPGTLVVVQGVVHTTDVPRLPAATSDDSAPSAVADPSDESRRSRASSTPAGARNRLSALLHGSRPSSRASNSRPSFSSEENDTSITPPLEASDFSSSSTNDSANAGVSTPETETATTTTSPTPTSSISSSSIDVLGTLLSVAAAATAASLLTGSSEPILSSGLSQPNSAAATPSPPPPPPRSSLFEPSPFRTPTPTPAPAIPGIGGFPDTTFGRAERMRQAWASVRDRLGLRSPPTSTNPSTETGASTTPGADGPRVPVDARERMLAEMARAFNLGLGLSTEGSNSNLPSDGIAENAPVEAEPPLPPEGSFERFLVDLQADLRTALMGDSSEARPEANQQTDDSADVGERREARSDERPEPTSVQQGEGATSDPDNSGEGTQVREEAGPEDQTGDHEGFDAGERDTPDSYVDQSALLAEGSHTASVVEAASHPQEILPSTSISSPSHDDSLPNTAAHDDDADNQSDGSLPPLQDISDDSDSDSDGGFDLSEGEDEDEAGHRPSIDSTASGLSQLFGDLLRSRPRRSATIGTSAGDTQNRPVGSEAWADARPPPRPHPSRTTGMSNSPSNPPAPGSDRINWWRLYRFPPIAAPRAQAAAENVAASMRSELAPLARAPGAPTTSPLYNSSGATYPSTTSPTPDSQTASTIPISPSMSTDSTQPRAGLNSPSGNPTEGSPTPESPPRSNIVVPVIVVGLQSVNMVWANDPTTIRDTLDHTDMDVDVPEEHDAPPPSPDNIPSLGTTRSETPRERRWQSRAANALRTLRPGGRRHATPRGFGLPDSDGPGSRTFLIYVIGGYYPPDHSIVTDEPDNFDSFEALLDLAELLGQVRPPTVSKQDIEKSGLEVIKASQLAEHEKNGKISSNCTERCLICLDDYEPENDVRVLSCKHGFHKNCVDKWLSEGRNNCPACRSKGVSDEFASPMPSTGFVH